jgi:hypothetical protein
MHDEHFFHFLKQTQIFRGKADIFNLNYVLAIHCKPSLRSAPFRALFRYRSMRRFALPFLSGAMTNRG